MKLTCIIVDDEPGAVRIMEEYVTRLNSVTLSGKFLNAIEAFHFMRNNQVDILLVDINMPEVDGFALLEMMEPKPVFIFTTAYSEHALKGFEVGAVDYLQKPIRFERFVKAMDKAERWRLVQQTKKIEECIELKSGKSTVVLKVGEISFIECLGNYLKFYNGAGSAVVLMTMKEIESRLPADIFVRVHKSYIINVLKIGDVKKDKIMVNDSWLPVGKTYKKYFASFFKKYRGG